LLPVIVLWAVSDPRAFGRRELAKTAVVIAGAAAVGLVVFSPLAPITAGKAPMSFLAMVPLLWAALPGSTRHSDRGALVACVAAWRRTMGGSPGQPQRILLLVRFAALPFQPKAWRRGGTAETAEQTARWLAAIVDSSDAILGKTLDGSITS
jgi:hypothetical protein